MKTQEDYIKEIADKINNGAKYIENPTLKDIQDLKDFESIITSGKFTDVIIRKKLTIETVLNVPVAMFDGSYEVGDEVMGFIPCSYDATGAYEEMLGFKGVIDIL